MYNAAVKCCGKISIKWRKKYVKKKYENNVRDSNGIYTGMFVVIGAA